MIDVHIISNPATPETWLRKALYSIPDICTTHLIPMEDRGVAENRIIGFQKGSHPYVSYVDDDDYVLPGAFEACLEFLENNPDYAAVSTWEYALDGMDLREIRVPVTANLNPWAAMHHLAVFRREAVLEHLESLHTFVHPERALVRAMDDAGLKAAKLDILGYVWRQHNSQHHRRVKNGT